MQLEKRTQQDWSQHVHTREVFKNEKGDEIITDRLEKQGTLDEHIVFINDQSGLTVRGDFGNWVFNRNFMPNGGNKVGVSDAYWMEKLIIGSEQKFDRLDFEQIEKDFKEEVEEALPRYAHSPYQIEVIKEWEEEVLNIISDEDKLGYIYKMHRKPSPVDWRPEDAPMAKKTPIWLSIVFDGFEEICRRRKAETHTERVLALIGIGQTEVEEELEIEMPSWYNEKQKEDLIEKEVKEWRGDNMNFSYQILK